MKESVIKSNILNALSNSEPRMRSAVMKNTNFDKLSNGDRATWERLWSELVRIDEIVVGGFSERGVTQWIRKSAPLQPAPPEDKGTVYLVGNRSLSWYKIGLTYNPITTRFRGIQNGVPFQIELLAHQQVGRHAGRVEAHLHAAFAERRIRGEWFCNVNPQQFFREIVVALGSTPTTAEEEVKES